MAILSWSLLWICGLLTQAAVLPPADEADCLTASEKTRLEKETRLDGRVRAYDDVCKRFENGLILLIQHQDLKAVPAHLKCWNDVLDQSLRDIENSPGRKDKSKALIRYEIHLRQAINSVQESKTRADVDMLDAFDAWLAHAEAIRQKIVAFLFPK